MPKLPIPSADALAHSARLTQHIQHEISRSSGVIHFARFMELALYAPGLGYYSAGSHKLGEKGDFTTAPEISPLYAQCVARQCQQILAAFTHGDILEIGAGSGQLACDLLSELEQLAALPVHYYILEISADLRARQAEKIRVALPHLFTRIAWLDKLPEQPITGIILANEVLDALPTTCFRIIHQKPVERAVTYTNNQFSWQIIEPLPELSNQVQCIQEECELSEGYESEVNLLLAPFIRSLQNSMKQGVILLFDYGYGRREYYHPDRNTGTLMCYYQQHRHDNPFLYVGLQDITAHIDFTTVAECTLDTDWELAGYTTQGSFLLAMGLLQLAEQKHLTTRESYQQNQAIKTLTLPAQMGELIKVMALTKNIGIPLLGFTLLDRRKDL
jgi:SAM-dependent MidA family methyltransferase